LLNYNFDHGYLPAEALGTSSSKYADYYYQISVGAFVALLGGSWNYGAAAGAFCWALSNGSSARDRHIGARLCA
jgi:formylglycine-generating enzyme required for sulfatase activity